MVKLTLPTDSEARKDVPVMSGCMNYFPAALAEIAKISVKGDRKHNPQNAGHPPFHARGKSMDHGDCIVRHTMDIEDLKAALARGSFDQGYGGDIAPALIEEAAYRAWRSCAELQELCEKYAGAPLAPAARIPSPVAEPLTAAEAQWRSLAAGTLDQPCGQGVPFKFPELIPVEKGRTVSEQARVDAMHRRVTDSEWREDDIGAPGTVFPNK